MIKVEFPGPIGKEPCELAVSNLKELKEALSADESVRPWLATCAVLVNDEIATALETPLHDGDRVAILAPVCGG